MHSVKIILLVFVLSLFYGYAWGQQAYTISLGNTTIVPNSNVKTFNIKDNIWQTHIFQERLYALLQFNKIPDQATHAKLRLSDIQLLDYIPANTYLASIPAATSEEILSLYDIRTVLAVQADWKLANALENGQFSNELVRNGKLKLLALLQKDIDKAEVLAELSKYGQLIQPKNALQSPQIVYIEIANSQTTLLQLAALPFIQYIQPKASEPFPLSNNARATQRANVIMNTGISGLGLTGSNVVIGVGDGGTIDQHIDLDDRILNAYNIDENAHGAKVTGIIAGEGILEPKMRGFAPQADIVAEVFMNVLNSTGTYYTALGMVLTNNSYGTIMTPFCSNAGDYNGSSKAMDQIANNYNYVLHCLAAGNDGDVNCSPYPASFGTVFQGLQSAKNILTVGSVDAYDVIADDSSRGPTQDGRIKPEIVGVGVNILSPHLNNQYSQGSGTSLSTPSVTGTFALLWEHYRNLNGGSHPTAALMKAIACNTADDLGNPGPDFTYGYGRINAQRAAEAISNNTYYENTITHGSTQTSVINVPANTAEVRVLVYWQDRDADPTAPQALVHDLDLSLDAPDGTNYRPWVLNTAPASVDNDAIRALDKANNIEQVTIDNPVAGAYTIEVKGASVAYGSQKYIVAYEIIPEQLQLTYPIGGEVFSGGEEMLITWDAEGYDTETFTLEYSFNNGVYWIPINTSVPADARQYSFITPNIISTSTLVRVSRNSSPLSSTSDAVFHILARPTNFSASPDCNGTINMSWVSSSGVSTYRIYEYQLGAWVQIATTSSTSFSVSGRTAGQLYCYTVKSDYGSGLFSESAFGACVTAYSTLINTMPYSEGFESDDGGWFAAGKNTDWEWGTPTGSIINSAASGNKAWVTNLDGNYANSSEAFLYSPCFDLSSLTAPTLSFSIIYSIEDNAMSPGNAFDIGQAQYSLNGKDWIRLGVNGGGTNWYSNTAGLHHWDGEQLSWTTANYSIPSTSSRVQFRILLDADQYGSEEGIGIDNICIREAGAACGVPRLQLKTVLGGVHNSGTSLMDDHLRQNGLIPMSEPYTALGYMHVGIGGGETTTSSVLAQTGNDAIIDWIIIEIRDPSTITTVVATRAALLQADGDIVEIDGTSSVAFPGLASGNYHVAIRHRNHLGAMTATPVFIGG